MCWVWIYGLLLKRHFGCWNVGVLQQRCFSKHHSGEDCVTSSPWLPCLNQAMCEGRGSLQTGTTTFVTKHLQHPQNFSRASGFDLKWPNEGDQQGCFLNWKQALTWALVFKSVNVSKWPAGGGKFPTMVDIVSYSEDGPCWPLLPSSWRQQSSTFELMNLF